MSVPEAVVRHMAEYDNWCMTLDDAEALRAFLVEHDRQAAALTAAETARDQAQADADALLAELAEARSDAKKQVARVAHQWAESQAQLAAAEARATRLAALEAAARAWAAIFTTGPAQEPWFSPWQALHAAVANLTVPPGEEA